MRIIFLVNERPLNFNFFENVIIKFCIDFVQTNRIFELQYIEELTV